MPTESPTEAPLSPKKSWLFSGAISLSLIVHAMILILIGGVVIIHSILPRSPFEASELSSPIETSEEKTEEEPPGPETENPPTESSVPQAVPTTDFQTSGIELIQTTAPSLFSLPSTPGGTGVGVGLGNSSTGSTTDGSSGGGRGGKKPKILTNLGSPEPTKDGLEGRLFDFKRSKKGSAGGNDIFAGIKNFLDGGWNFEKLGDVYEVPTRLYATQILIPYIDANLVPQAFGVENEMQPSHWAVIYSGKVLPPRTGRYRFIGNADDILAVGVNGKTVLIGCVRNSDFGSQTKWKKTSDETLPGPGGSLICGDWVELTEGESISLQILVSEVPGGGFGAWLLWEREGAKYPKLPDGTPQPPVFQMIKKPDLPRMDLPPLSWGKEYWKAPQ